MCVVTLLAFRGQAGIADVMAEYGLESHGRGHHH